MSQEMIDVVCRLEAAGYSDSATLLRNLAQTLLAQGDIPESLEPEPKLDEIQTIYQQRDAFSQIVLAYRVRA